MIEIRRADKDDVTRLFELITAIAEHHGQGRYVLTNPDELLAAGFGDNQKFGALIAEYDGATVGFVSYTMDYSIWLGSDYMRIDDIFVDSNFRGKNIGERLMREAKALCDNLGVPRIKWEMQRDNAAARRFYERLGASYHDKDVFTWG